MGIGDLIAAGTGTGGAAPNLIPPSLAILSAIVRLRAVSASTSSFPSAEEGSTAAAGAAAGRGKAGRPMALVGLRVGLVGLVGLGVENEDWQGTSVAARRVQ